MLYKKQIALSLFSMMILIGCGGSDSGNDSTDETPVTVEDNDNDGIVNADDLCPNEAGIAANNGCPDKDTDQDEVVDRLDDCPEQAGSADNNGCPVIVQKDTDLDGIMDENDDCVEQKGPEVLAGCPYPKDDDYDGVANADDLCPQEKGIAAQQGCPAPEPENAFYVSLQGDDTNDGSKENPFKTFAKAQSVMQAGDTCIVRGGVYNEVLKIDANGTEQAPILFKAANGEKVYLKGTQYVNNWVQHQGDIYKTNIKMNLGDTHNQVYYQSKLMDIARWPNNTDNDRFTIDAHPIDGGDGSMIEATGLPNDLTGGYVWYLGAHSGTSWTRKITDQQPGQIQYQSVNINKWPFSPHNPSVYRNDNYGRLYVFGKLNLLDHAREWYYDDNTETLYLQTPNGEKPADNTVEIATHKDAIIINGEHVEVRAFDIFGAGVVINGHYAKVTDNIVTHGRERLDELDNSDAQVGDGSILVNAHHATIKGNILEQGSLVAINLLGWGGRGDGSIVENNVMRYFNSVGIHASAIRTGADNVKILKNTISHFGRDGIYYSGQNGEVAYNDVSNGMLINNDGGVFYTVGNDDLKHTRIHHNWFHDSYGPDYADGRAAGIYLDNNSKGYLVHHNVVWNVTWSGLQLNWAIWQNDMYHNTLWNPGNAMDAWVNGYEQKDNRVWNNYSSKSDWLKTAAYDLKNNIIASESPFMDADGANFMPKPDSVLIDAAIDISGFDKNVVGEAPDIGAYERGAVQWTAGVNAIIDEQ